jgi:hypothetical protein
MQVPNALLAEVKGTPGGCSAISISRDGRWLVAACGDDKGRFKVGQAHISTNCNIALHWTPPLLLTKQAIGREKTGPASLLVMPNIRGAGGTSGCFHG